MKREFKIALFVLFCLILVIPLLFSFVDLNRKIALKGAVALTEKPEFETQSWFSGEFQNGYEKYINDNIGFRPIFVRIRNQILFTFFGEAKAAGVIEGKEGFLFEENYLKAYNGFDFLGTSEIKNRILQLKILQDSLQQKGKTLLVCLAPGKGSFYPEHFPENYNQAKTDSTNYNIYQQYLGELGVNHIDFNRWFLEMKDTSEYILYPKYGIHWSYYGMVLASDSLIRKVEKLRNADLPDLIIGDYKLSRSLDRMDYDIADGMNLLWQLPSEPMCYPENSWEPASGKTQPKTILVGDSFYWSMFQLGIWAKSFSPGGFWFYNKQVYPESFDTPLQVENVNYLEAIENNDIFILLVTEANLPKFPWGFTDAALLAFNPDYKFTEPEIKEVNSSVVSNAELKKTIADIRASEKWMKDIQRKATEKNISIDSMLVLDALWMIDYKKSQDKK